jgi:hypothetical protein
MRLVMPARWFARRDFRREHHGKPGYPRPVKPKAPRAATIGATPWDVGPDQERVGPRVELSCSILMPSTELPIRGGEVTRLF